MRQVGLGHFTIRAKQALGPLSTGSKDYGTHKNDEIFNETHINMKRKITLMHANSNEENSIWVCGMENTVNSIVDD